MESKLFSSSLPFIAAASTDVGCQARKRISRRRTWGAIQPETQQHPRMLQKRPEIMQNAGRINGEKLLSFSNKKIKKHLAAVRDFSTPENCSESEVVGGLRFTHIPSYWKSVLDGVHVFFRFSRPYTVKATTMSVISVSLLAVEQLSDFSPLFVIGLLKALVAALLMNTYVQGINQLNDIEIDKINKPYLPLASGECSFSTGVTIITSCAITSFLVAWNSRPLLCGIFITFVLSTTYSAQLPMLRWKKYPIAAALSILAVRGVVYQIAYYLHMLTVYGRPVMFPKPLIFATAFMGLFSFVIALFKDIPDTEGDLRHGIRSFSVRLGQKKMFWISISLLELGYVAAILVGASASNTWSRFTTVLGHAALASVLWKHAKCLDLKNKAAISSFYMFIWKLFYAEYLLIPLLR